MMLSNGKTIKTPDKKLTDAEIKKALDCCAKSSCNGCAFQKESNNLFDMSCVIKMVKATLDLINRQKAELEKSKALNKEIMQTVAGVRELAIDEYKQMLKSRLTEKMQKDGSNLAIGLGNLFCNLIDEMPLQDMVELSSEEGE